MTPGVEICEQTPYYGYVYMWSDLERNKFYIGSHKGSIYDKYKSGSKWLNDAIKKRPDTVKFRVLEYYYGTDRNELYKLEDKYLIFFNVELNDNFYNFKNQAKGGTGPFKHKGKKRIEYTPGWIDHRKGKKLEEIYKDPESIRRRIGKTMSDFYIKNGHGVKKGKKHSKDSRRGKTVEEIYGYRRLANPNKPFIITVQEPGKETYEIYCRHEPDFFNLVKMESDNLGILKKTGKKIVLRRQPSTKHDFEINTVLTFKFVDEKD
jgi:hypothetical protein